MVLIAPQKKNLFAPNLEKKPPEKLTEHTRKELCTPKWTPKKLYNFFVILTPKSPTRRDFMV